MPKKRIKIPKNIQDQILVANKHLCCIRNEEGRGVAIHHIDGDPSNNEPSNLCVLCLHHHEKAEAKSSMSKNITPDQLKIYKEQWEKNCKVTITKEKTVNNYFILSKKNPILLNPKISEGFTSSVTSAATINQITLSVNASTDTVFKITGDSELAKQFNDFLKIRNNDETF